MKIVITDCSWGSYDVERKHLPADAEVVCTQILTIPKVKIRTGITTIEEVALRAGVYFEITE